MRILPVLDIMNGVVVRGVAGRREEYRPILSRLTSSTVPLAVARAFREHFGFTELYVADLDAIGGKLPAVSVYRDLLQDGFRLWVDAGTYHDELAAIGVHTLIAGLESLRGPKELETLLEGYGAERLVYSLDLKDGQPLRAWPIHAGDAASVAYATEAICLGVKRILVLDLALVGVGQGTGTLELCGRLRAEFPHIEITAGGGIRGAEDLRGMQALGIDAVLVASALHDGRLTKDALAGLIDSG